MIHDISADLDRLAHYGWRGGNAIKAFEMAWGRVRAQLTDAERAEILVARDAAIRGEGRKRLEVAVRAARGRLEREGVAA